MNLFIVVCGNKFQFTSIKHYNTHKQVVCVYDILYLLFKQSNK